MDNSKATAVLFYGKNKIPIPFTKYKKYDVGTGYIVLYGNSENDKCFLCRLLDEQEISYFSNNKNMLVVRNSDSLSENQVIVLNANLTSVFEADEIIKNIC